MRDVQAVLKYLSSSGTILNISKPNETTSPPSSLILSPAKTTLSQKRKFSATPQTGLPSPRASYHWISSLASATSLATGFSLRTCFPAERAFLMYSA